MTLQVWRSRASLLHGCNKTVLCCTAHWHMCVEMGLLCNCLLQGLLSQHAPVVLRGYYERDSRQQFCQPNLWTEPYSNMMASLEAAQRQQQAGGVLATTAAVVQALLAGVGLTGEDEEDNGNSGSSRASSPLPSPAAAVGSVGAGGSSIPGLRTGALLLLLRSAPQCVPFAVRLELFRQMLEQDKVREQA
jgi:hypothetical protein